MIETTRSERLAQLISSGETLLAEGSVYELLRRDPDIRFDPEIAHASLIYEESSRERLRSVHAAYLAIAGRNSLPIVAFADTWRASAERIARSPFRGRAVNRDNVEFLAAIVTASGADAFVGALTGPRGDAYRPEEAPDEQTALTVHAPQIAELASAGADLIVAATLPSFGEARAMASLLAATGTLWMLSFVVRPAGVLLDGTPLHDAISEIDDRCARAPIGYSINCVHPDIARQALAAIPIESRRRVILFQGNTSARTPEELDNLPFVDSAEPRVFAESIGRLMNETSVRIVGGCCGSDVSHIEAVAAALRKRDQAAAAEH